MEIEYKVVYSPDRIGICIHINPDASVTVYAPTWEDEKDIEAFVAKHKRWIRRKQERKRLQQEVFEQTGGCLSEEEVKALKERAKREFEPRLRAYAQQIGVHPTKLTIRAQKARWGSCSAKGHISLNCVLLFAPEEAQDSVIVHELCHLKQMNHSARFYEECRKAFPRYDEVDQWFKKYGSGILRKLR